MSLPTVAYDAAAVNDLVFLTPERGWLLTHSQLLETSDAGRKWSEQYSGEGRRFFSTLLFSDARSGWIIGSALEEKGSRGLIFHTADGGASWIEQPVSREGGAGPDGLRGLSRCGATLWTVGDGSVVRTLNNVRTWEVQNLNTDGERLTNIVCADSERVLAVGTGGLILQSRDGGATWHRQVSGVTSHLLKARHSGGKFWVVGEDGVIMRCTADTFKWERLAKVTHEALYDIYISGERG